MNITNAVDNVIEKNKDKVEVYVENQSNESLNYLIGKALQETNGEYNPSEVETELLSQLKNANTEVGYPRELIMYHRADEISIAEKLSNKLRGELNVPLESVDIPEQFNVEELKVKYDIHKDGTVEFVEVVD